MLIVTKLIIRVKMGKILIKNGRVWDGENFVFTDILTDDEIVVKIEPNIIDDSAYVYNALGKIVSAGLVDTHVHILVDKKDEYGIQAEMSCFPFGVTAAADAGRKIGNPSVLEYLMLKNQLYVRITKIIDGKTVKGINIKNQENKMFCITFFIMK